MHRFSTPEQTGKVNKQQVKQASVQVNGYLINPFSSSSL